jgi:hypothetical protein
VFNEKSYKQVYEGHHFGRSEIGLTQELGTFKRNVSQQQFVGQESNG